MRTQTTPLIALTTLLAASPSLLADGGYTVRQIQADTDGLPYVTRPLVLDAEGRVAGHQGANRWHAFAADAEGGVTDLHIWPADWISSGDAISSTGYIAIHAAQPPPGDGAFTSGVARYTPGVGVEDLSSLGGPYVYGQSIYNLAIDDSGRVAAHFRISLDHQTWVFDDATGWTNVHELVDGAWDTPLIGMDTSGRAIFHAQGPEPGIYRYAPETGVEALLPLPSDQPILYPASNDNGDVVGSRRVGTFWQAFMVTADGAFKDIHALLPGASSSSGRVISSSGVVGGVFTAGGKRSLFILDGDDLYTMPAPGDTGGPGLIAINDRGEMIGGFVESGTYALILFMVKADGSMTLLGDLVDQDVYSVVSAADINDAGELLVSAVKVGTSPQETVALVLTPELSDCPADISGDGIVGATDLIMLLSAYGSSDEGDLDGDGDTDWLDLNILLVAYGDTCP